MTGGWTLDTLETHLSAKLSSLEKTSDEREERNKERFTAAKETIAVAMTAADKAIVKAETATEKRFDSVNEFRQTLSDQAAQFMPRTEYRISHEALSEKVDGVVGRLTALESSKEATIKTGSQFAAWIFGVIAIAISLATLIVLIVRH
jgi:hypothetical protein